MPTQCTANGDVIGNPGDVSANINSGDNASNSDSDYFCCKIGNSDCVHSSDSDRTYRNGDSDTTGNVSDDTNTSDNGSNSNANIIGVGVNSVNSDSDSYRIIANSVKFVID